MTASQKSWYGNIRARHTKQITAKESKRLVLHMSIETTPPKYDINESNPRVKKKGFKVQ